MRVRGRDQVEDWADLIEYFKTSELKRYFRLFHESTLGGSRTTAREMTQIAAGQTKNNPKFLLFHNLFLLLHCDTEMLRRPCSPLLLMLQFVDPNVLDQPSQTVQRKGSTLLH